MRRYIISLLVVVALLLPASASYSQSVSFQAFYDQLSPYGSWINYQQYGYVWIPTSVPSGFRPYATGGHWIYTEDGWTWASDYDWGWAPFHYGNWFYDDAYGWIWRPGYDWAPAWVTWGEYNGNYGWAPIGPDISIGLSFSTYRPPLYCWNFVPYAYIASSNLSHYYVRRSHITVVNNITVINNVYRGGGGRPQFMRGPQANVVERYTHRAIRPTPVVAAARPGRNQVAGGRFTVYRPTINRDPGTRPAPARAQNTQNFHPATLPGRNPNIGRHGEHNNPSSGNHTLPMPGMNHGNPGTDRGNNNHLPTRPNPSANPVTPLPTPSPAIRPANPESHNPQHDRRPNVTHNTPVRPQQPAQPVNQPTHPLPQNRPPANRPANPVMDHRPPQPVQRPMQHPGPVQQPHPTPQHEAKPVPAPQHNQPPHPIPGGERHEGRHDK